MLLMLLQLLLQGSFGQVVEAQDLVNKQIVAIKIVQKKQQYTEQAQTEINILQQLHLPQQHDATNHIGRFFFHRLALPSLASLGWFRDLF